MEPTAVEIVLQNQFLLREIFQFLNEDRKGCINAALTCQIFRDPGQDELWRYVDCGIIPLLQLLPVFEGREMPENKVDWFLAGGIGTAAMDRMKSFARRVRHLSCTQQKSSWTISPSVYIILLTALQGEALCPNLQRLSWDLNSSDWSTVLQLLYSPRLKEVNFTCTGSQEASWLYDIQAYFETLVAHNPPLTIFTTDLQYNQVMLDFIPTTFSNLAVLQLHVETGTVVKLPYLRTLSKLRQLRQLDLQVDSIDMNAAADGSKICFQALYHLSIGCKVEEILFILSHCSFPSLHLFAYAFNIPGDPFLGMSIDWTPIFNSLRFATSPGLKELYFAPRKGLSPELYLGFLNHYAGVPFGSFSESLFRFESLVALGLEFPICRTLTSDDYNTIITTWPQLTFLHLRSVSSAEKTPGVSVLKSIAEGLPHLKELALDMDASTLRAIKGSPTSFFHQLRKLSVNLNNWTDDVINIARFVSYVDALFPCLTTLEELSFEDGHEGRMQGFLSQLQFVRQVERFRQEFAGFNVLKPSRVEEGMITRQEPLKLELGNDIVVASY